MRGVLSAMKRREIRSDTKWAETNRCLLGQVAEIPVDGLLVLDPESFVFRSGLEPRGSLEPTLDQSQKTLLLLRCVQRLQVVVIEHILVVLRVILQTKRKLVDNVSLITLIRRSCFTPNLFSRIRNCSDWKPDAGVRYFLKSTKSSGLIVSRSVICSVSSPRILTILSSPDTIFSVFVSSTI